MMSATEIITTIVVAIIGGVSPIIVELIKSRAMIKDKPSEKSQDGIYVPGDYKFHKLPKRKLISNWQWILILTLLGGLSGYILGSKIDSNNSVDSPLSVTLTPIAFSEQSVPINPSLDGLAQNITAGVGEVTKIVTGTNNRVIIVIEEVHGSRLGQIEIAIILNRLYENYGLRHIGQEGVFAVDGALNADWFHPSLSSGQVLSLKDKVALQLLSEGEITSGEALTLIYPDFQVHGVEVPSEYNYDPPDTAWTAPIFYLYQIAVTKMTNNDEINKANELINADKTLEAIEYIISTDPWTSEKYAFITDETTINSAEEWLQLLDDIEAEANRGGIIISEEDQKAMQYLKEFYSKASNRSNLMAENMLDLASVYPETPLALIIGAAHTDMVSKMLTEAGVSVVVVRPESITKNNSSDLSSSEYDRKTQSLSVDSAGGIGALLDNRKKPQPVLNRVWFRSKAESYWLIALLARNESKEHPLMSSQLSSQFGQMQYVKLVPDSYHFLNDEKVFALNSQVENLSSPIQIWVRAKSNQREKNVNLAQALDLIFLSDFIRNMPHSEEPAAIEPMITNITSNIVAIFSTDKSVIENTSLEDIKR